MADSRSKIAKGEHGSRSRSRSPGVQSRKRPRSPGSTLRPHHSHHHGRHHKDRRKERKQIATKPSPPSKPLAYDARPLSKQDYLPYKPMFAMYLDIQKNLSLEELDSTEAKGRWKSFMGKWNRGELAEGWYDPATLQKAVQSASTILSPAGPLQRRPSPEYAARHGSTARDSMSDDEPGPSLPGHHSANKAQTRRSGPAIPTLQDMELNREADAESALDARESLRLERRANRDLEKERLDELVPRAEGGTKERQLEKKRELASANRAFATAKEGGDVADVPDADLMGDDANGLDSFKRKKKETQRKLNDREIRREAIMRARREEREIRAEEFREREERTMKGLVDLARKRFG